MWPRNVNTFIFAIFVQNFGEKGLKSSIESNCILCKSLSSIDKGIGKLSFVVWCLKFNGMGKKSSLVNFPTIITASIWCSHKVSFSFIWCCSFSPFVNKTMNSLQYCLTSKQLPILVFMRGIQLEVHGVSTFEIGRHAL